MFTLMRRADLAERAAGPQAELHCKPLEHGQLAFLQAFLQLEQNAWCSCAA